MYTVHQETLTPVRMHPHAPVDHYYSVVHVSIGGCELYYKLYTDPKEVEARGKDLVRKYVAHALRKGIMYEIERHLFQIDANGAAMGPQL